MATKDQLIFPRACFLEWTHEDWENMGDQRHNLRPMFKDNKCNMPLEEFRIVMAGRLDSDDQVYQIMKGARYFWSMWEVPKDMDVLTLVRMRTMLMESALQCWL